MADSTGNTAPFSPAPSRVMEDMPLPASSRQHQEDAEQSTTMPHARPDQLVTLLLDQAIAEFEAAVLAEPDPAKCLTIMNDMKNRVAEIREICEDFTVQGYRWVHTNARSENVSLTKEQYVAQPKSVVVAGSEIEKDMDCATQAKRKRGRVVKAKNRLLETIAAAKPTNDEERALIGYLREIFVDNPILTGRDPREQLSRIFLGVGPKRMVAGLNGAITRRLRTKPGHPKGKGGARKLTSSDVLTFYKQFTNASKGEGGKEAMPDETISATKRELKDWQLYEHQSGLYVERDHSTIGSAMAEW